MKRITPCLWFDGNAEEAANFYVSIFKDARIKQVTHYPESVSKASGQAEGSVMTVVFELNGQEFMGLNGGPQFKFSEAISMMVMCKDQDEIDHYWSKLSGDGGEESVCGWLKDKFGMSWQIVPNEFHDLIRNEKPKRTNRVMAAMMEMKKMDIAKLRAAAKG